MELLRLCTILSLNQEDRQETAQIPARLFKCKKDMQESLPQGVNSLRLLAAAQAMNIPTKRITGRLHRYGWGFTSILMDSSVTQFDSAIGCNASKDKLFTKNILRDAGLPVVEGEVARSVDHAWQLASQFGLPVVLKPRNADGGLEVHVRLSSEEEVREAANAIFARSHQVLVERYYSSRDYRVHVHQGSIFRVVERRPGFVRGDGKSTILELLSLKNLEIAKVVGSQGGQRMPIELDLEAKRMLAYQGLTPASIPTDGDTVYLRGAANISRGGEIVPALDSAHPDNLRLAIRAAEALHLDLAGVDLLLPDISESWLQTGGIICEVNAQPQIATGHDVLLNKLLGGDGRIPIDVVLGLESVLPLKDSLDRRRRQGDSGGIGLVGQDGVFLDDECLSGPPEDQFLATSMLLGCQHLRHLILAPWHDSLAVDGLPIDRFDKLIVCTSADNLCNGQSQSLQPEGKLWSTLKQMCHSCHRTDTLEALLEYFVNGGRE
ncbi:acetate--CoA ligase family protein [Synechococcus sp. CCY9201]|uniref:acetate--CoA ligase family protein n=1 Tax=Synechococcus sp. CCY9201 TaxID=174697 RepID=UPI002B1F3C5C|nr:acetate--CoA ligase family protein [Synechococcus sp. CCY9201]MEA5472631.1 acetate--CoA ligase family protein [Synechococcus sp. CCY9201]